MTWQHIVWQNAVAENSAVARVVNRRKFFGQWCKRASQVPFFPHEYA